ncbi:hypothetical protein BX666DRAFT_2023977 [Dichotomocladium elegans]|nr:hypothetical protein BX666DRAFT_2023977 [Dichotomocladium elegans]
MRRLLLQQPILLAASIFLLLLVAPCGSLGIPLTCEEIQVDRLAQHIVSHWHFDHLEPLATSRYSQLANTLVEEHLEIRARRLAEDGNDGQVDAAVLEAQVLEGIYSHIQGVLLPSMWWDDVAQPLLSQKALAALVRDAVEEYCPGDTVAATCLLDHATHLSRVIDGRINAQLDWALEKLDTEVAPKALAHTFALLQRLQLDVRIKQPWVARPSSQQQEEATVRCGSAHVFTQYLDLARVQ